MPWRGNHNEIMPCLRQLVASLSLQRQGFYPRPVAVGFGSDSSAVGQHFLPILQFSPAIVILLKHHTHAFIHHWYFLNLTADTSLSITLKKPQLYPKYTVLLLIWPWVWHLSHFTLANACFICDVACHIRPLCVSTLVTPCTEFTRTQ
jgi:hypothetical protein